MSRSCAIICFACLLFYGVSTAWAGPAGGQTISLRQPDGVLIQARAWGDEYYQELESLDGYVLVRDPATQAFCYARLSSDGNALFSTGVRAGGGDPARLGLARHLKINQTARAAKAQAGRASADEREATMRAQAAQKLGKPLPTPQPLFNPRDPATVATKPLQTIAPLTLRGICLLIDFPDDPANATPAQVERFCNEVGYTDSTMTHDGNKCSVRDYFYDVSDGLINYTNYVAPAFYRAPYPKSYYFYFVTDKS